MARLPKLSKITWAIMAFLGISMIALWFVEEKSDVRILHLGYTNITAMPGPFAVVIITNAGPGNVTIWPEYFIESDASKKRVGEMRQLSGIIPGGSSIRIVELPQGTRRWRQTVLYSPDGFRGALAEHLGANEKGFRQKLLRDWLHLVKIKRTSSAWVEL
jgi:hypothetical protein